MGPFASFWDREKDKAGWHEVPCTPPHCATCKYMMGWRGWGNHAALVCQLLPEEPNPNLTLLNALFEETAKRHREEAVLRKTRSVLLSVTQICLNLLLSEEFTEILLIHYIRWSNMRWEMMTRLCKCMAAVFLGKSLNPWLMRSGLSEQQILCAPLGSGVCRGPQECAEHFWPQQLWLKPMFLWRCILLYTLESLSWMLLGLFAYLCAP